MKSKSLKKNALLNVIKQLCAIIFPLITFPYATRILGKENFGKINFSSSIISYISLIASLGITNYAIREGSRIKDSKERFCQFVSQIFSINILSMFFAYFVLLFLMIFWKNLNDYSTLLLIQCTSVFFTTIGTDWINSIYEDYLYITLRYILSQILSLILMFIFVKSSNDYILYCFIMILASILANVSNYIYIRKKYDLHPKFTLEIDFKKHLKPILILFGTTISSVIYVNSDITILGVLKNESTVGIYSVSVKIYSIVKQLINALLIVTIPRISNELITKSKEEVNKTLEEIFSFIIMITGPISCGLYFLSGNLVELLSGAEYIESVSSLKILSVAILFAVLVTYFVYVILIPYKKEKIALIATIISAVVNLILNFLLIPHFGANAAAFTTLISELLTTIIGVYYASKLINIKVLKPILIGVFNSIFSSLVCIIVLSFNIYGIYQIFISFAIVGIVTLLNTYLFFKKNHLHKIIC